VPPSFAQEAPEAAAGEAGTADDSSKHVKENLAQAGFDSRAAFKKL
jgi:hypothetical protein